MLILNNIFQRYIGCIYLFKQKNGLNLMTLYLVQHGQSLAKELDPNRGLSVEGRNEIVQVANIASNSDITVSTIFHSGKLRTSQTAELFAEHLKTDTIEKIDGLLPLDSVTSFADHFHFDDRSMIVGHLPFLNRLTSYLITGDQDISVIKFQNAGIICLDQDNTNRWFIKWAIMPVID